MRRNNRFCGPPPSQGGATASSKRHEARFFACGPWWERYEDGVGIFRGSTATASTPSPSSARTSGRCCAPTSSSAGCRPMPTVLDMAAGHCEFINNIKAARRLAVDLNPDLDGARGPGRGDARSAFRRARPPSPPTPIDRVFICNFFEHVPHEAILATLVEARRVLSPAGQLLVFQPERPLLRHGLLAVLRPHHPRGRPGPGRGLRPRPASRWSTTIPAFPALHHQEPGCRARLPWCGST